MKSDCVTEGDYWAKKIRDLNLKLIQIPRKSHFDLTRLIKLIKTFWSFKPDIVHTYLSSANSYGRVAAIFTKIPVIIASERSSYQLGINKKRYEIIIDKILFLFTDAIICNSINASKSLIEKHSFNKKKIYVVHNGVEKKTNNSNQNINNGDVKVIGMVANHLKWKNYPLFIDAVKIIINNYDNYLHFLTVGDGPLRLESESYAKELGLSEYIDFARSTDNVPEFLNKINIFVSTSSYEGLSNSIMEAMSAGLPCVVTNVGGNAELVSNGETGFLVSPNNPKALAEKLLLLLNDDVKSKRFGALGSEKMLKKFSIKNMVNETEKIYNKLLINCD